MAKVTVRVRAGRIAEGGKAYEFGNTFECERDRARALGDVVEIVGAPDLPDPPATPLVTPRPSSKKKRGSAAIETPDFDAMIKPEDGFRG